MCLRWQETVVDVVICLCAMADCGSTWIDSATKHTSCDSTYLMHTAGTEILPHTSRATNMVECEYSSQISHSIYKTPRSKDLVVFCLSLG